MIFKLKLSKNNYVRADPVEPVPVGQNLKFLIESEKPFDEEAVIVANVKNNERVCDLPIKGNEMVLPEDYVSPGKIYITISIFKHGVITGHYIVYPIIVIGNKQGSKEFEEWCSAIERRVGEVELKIAYALSSFEEKIENLIATNKEKLESFDKYFNDLI